MSLTNEEYDKLEKALFGAATGSELHTKQESQVEEYVDPQSGRKKHMQRVKATEKADVALAMKLLDERIGGPQDFC